MRGKTLLWLALVNRATQASPNMNSVRQWTKFPKSRSLPQAYPFISSSPPLLSFFLLSPHFMRGQKRKPSQKPMEMLAAQATTCFSLFLFFLYFTRMYSNIHIYSSYATLSSGIPWNTPRVTCIFDIHTIL